MKTRKKKAIKNEKESIKYIELGEHVIFKNNKKIHFNQFGNNLKLECRDVDEFMETSFMDLDNKILTGPLINSDGTIDDSIEMSDMNIFYNFRYTPEAIYAHVKTPANKERNILHERYMLGLPLYFKFYICLKNNYRTISHSDPTVIIEILHRRKNLKF